MITQNLEEKIKKENTRREFLKKIGKTLTSLALASYLTIFSSSACKKNDNPIIPDIPVTLQFDVYNHTQGHRGNLTRNYMSRDEVLIKINELGVNNVDSQRIAIREDNFGDLVVFSRNGEATFEAPRQDKNYDVFLFNALPSGVSYQFMDEQDSKLWGGKHDYVLYRRDFDGQTGPESIWANTIDPANEFLNPNWAPFRYGSIERRPNAGSGDISYGYADCGGGDGCNNKTTGKVAVNYKKLGNIMSSVAIGLSETFELITYTQNIGGWPSGWFIQHWGVLTQEGKDLFTYIFVKE
jgi:hypothetical protein